VRCDGDESIRPVRVGAATRTLSWSWGSVKGYVSPFRCDRFMQLQRHELWQVEIQTTPNMTWVPTATANHVCKVHCTTPLVEAQVGDRSDMAHYCWRIQAAVETSRDTYLSFAAHVWPDEPVFKGQTVWLLRAASMRPHEKRPVRFAGLVIVPASAVHIQYWRRIGYWHSTSGVVRVEDPPDEYRRAALRTAQLGGQIGFSPSVQLL